TVHFTRSSDSSLISSANFTVSDQAPKRSNSSSITTNGTRAATDFNARATQSGVSGVVDSWMMSSYLSTTVLRRAATSGSSTRSTSLHRASVTLFHNMSKLSPLLQATRTASAMSNDASRKASRAM